jgi:hypothetical protein
MAFPTSVNDQITDAVTQANVKVLGDAPAQALAALYQSIAQSIALSAQNAVAAQQNANTLMEAVVAKTVAHLLGTTREKGPKRA